MDPQIRAPIFLCAFLVHTILLLRETPPIEARDAGGAKGSDTKIMGRIEALLPPAQCEIAKNPAAIDFLIVYVGDGRTTRFKMGEITFRQRLLAGTFTFHEGGAPPTFTKSAQLLNDVKKRTAFTLSSDASRNTDAIVHELLDRYKENHIHEHAFMEIGVKNPAMENKYSAVYRLIPAERLALSYQAKNRILKYQLGEVQLEQLSAEQMARDEATLVLHKPLKSLPAEPLKAGKKKKRATKKLGHAHLIRVYIHPGSLTHEWKVVNKDKLAAAPARHVNTKTMATVRAELTLEGGRVLRGAGSQLLTKLADTARIEIDVRTERALLAPPLHDGAEVQAKIFLGENLNVRKALKTSFARSLFVNHYRVDGETTIIELHPYEVVVQLKALPVNIQLGTVSSVTLTLQDGVQLTGVEEISKNFAETEHNSGLKFTLDNVRRADLERKSAHGKTPRAGAAHTEGIHSRVGELVKATIELVNGDHPISVDMHVVHAESTSKSAHLVIEAGDAPTNAAHQHSSHVSLSRSNSGASAHISPRHEHDAGQRGGSGSDPAPYAFKPKTKGPVRDQSEESAHLEKLFEQPPQSVRNRAKSWPPQQTHRVDDDEHSLPPPAPKAQIQHENQDPFDESYNQPPLRPRYVVNDQAHAHGASGYESEHDVLTEEPDTMPLGESAASESSKRRWYSRWKPSRDRFCFFCLFCFAC